MRLTVLGSGTIVPDDDRRGSAYLVEADDVRLLLDCGSGTLHGFDRYGVDWPAITHVALSHYHGDHAGDVAALLVALRHGVETPRRRPLTVLGPPGLERFLALLSEAFRTDLSDPGFPLGLVEMGRHGSWEDPGGTLRLACHATLHTESSVAWRVDAGDARLGYTGDTGAHAPLAEFLAGVDVLITECSFPDPPPMETHLTPAGVAELAREAAPGLVLLTHLYPGLDLGKAPGMVRAAGFVGRVEVAHDGLVMVIGDGEFRGKGPAARPR